MGSFPENQSSSTMSVSKKVQLSGRPSMTRNSNKITVIGFNTVFGGLDGVYEAVPTFRYSDGQPTPLCCWHKASCGKRDFFIQRNKDGRWCIKTFAEGSLKKSILAWDACFSRNAPAIRRTRS